MKYSAATIAIVALLAGRYPRPACCAVEQDEVGRANEDDRALLRGGGGGREMEGEAGSKPKRTNNGLLRSIYGDYMLAETGTTTTAAELMQRDGTDGGGIRRADWKSAAVWKQKTGGPAMILVQVTATGGGAEELLEPAFVAHGFEKTGCSEYRCSGYLPIEEFPGFETRAEVKAIAPSMPMTRQAGSTVSEAVKSLRVDLVRLDDPELTGRGIKIGIMSDSYNFLQGEADDIASGDLPSGVTVVKEFEQTDEGSPAIDEGRAMAQLIHDLVPEAQLFFYTAFGGPDAFAKGIQELADLGCDVIVDDVGDMTEPFFQDGVIAKSANDVAELRGIPYFSAAGNQGKTSWEGAFLGSGMFDELECEIHDFGGGVTRQGVQIVPGDASIAFQWDDPFSSVSGPPGASRDMNARVYLRSTGDIIVEATDNNEEGDPIILFIISNSGSGNITVELEFTLCRGTDKPVLMKWIGFDAIGEIDFDTESSTSFGHPNAEYTAGVGEAWFINTPVFGVSPPDLIFTSSRGGTPILFDRVGERLPEREVRNQPRFVATGLCINTFFGPSLDLDVLPSGPGFYFAGTSAAAPNAAAVAALLLQVDPTLTPTEVYDILAQTAIDMEGDGYDFDSGAGYIDAVAAVNLAKEGVDSEETPTDPEETPPPMEEETPPPTTEEETPPPMEEETPPPMEEETPSDPVENNPYDNYSPGEDGPNPYEHLHKPVDDSSSSSSSSDDHD